MSSVLRRSVRRSLAAAAVTLPLVAGGAIGADSALAAGMSLKLVNASNGQALGSLVEGQNLDLATVGKTLDVIADPADAATKSVKLCRDGTCRTENSAPYTLDNTSDSALWTPSEGAHTITATGYSAANATGTKLGDTTVKFTVGTPVPAPSLELVNQKTGAALGALVNGQTIDLAKVGRTLDVIADPADAATKSVKLCLDGSCRTENSAPYTLDDTSDSTAWAPAVGTHTLTVTGYSAAGATGTKRGETTITFTVVDTTTTPTPAPTAPAVPAPALKLVNQKTGAALGALVNGQTIDLAKVGTTLDVIADPADAATTSVKLCLDGACRVEGSAPFTLDDASDATAWTPKLGTHTLTVTGYTAAGATGTKRGETTVTFTVVDTTPAPTATAPTTTAPTTTTPSTSVPAGSVLWSHPMSALSPAFDATPWNIYGGGSVSIVKDAVKGNVYRSFGAKNQSQSGSQRAEQVPSRKFASGETVWAGFDLWTNAGLPTSSTWASVMQFKTGGAQDGAPPVSLDVNAHGAAGLDIASARIAGTEAVHKLGAAPNGNWTRLVVGIHVNTDPAKAWVEVWRDGKQVLAREPWRTVNYPAYGNKVGGTMFPGGSGVGYFKFGVYRGPQGFDIDARYANIKFTTTREAAM
jgi:hypothetical protein